LKLALSTPRSAASILLAVAGANFSASFDLMAVVYAYRPPRGVSCLPECWRPRPSWSEQPLPAGPM